MAFGTVMGFAALNLDGNERRNVVRACLVFCLDRSSFSKLPKVVCSSFGVWSLNRSTELVANDRPCCVHEVCKSYTAEKQKCTLWKNSMFSEMKACPPRAV